MKRCPTCNQTFDEEWLSFCTQDGTTLIDDAGSRSEPPPTMVTSPPSVPTPSDPGAMNLSPQFGSQPIQPAWQPPPPPAYAQPQNKSLATASMVLGIISATVGWMCFGPIPGVIALVLGFVALSQIKKYPERLGGKQFAWVGIITGSLTIVVYACIMLFYVIMIAIGAANR